MLAFACLLPPFKRGGVGTWSGVPAVGVVRVSATVRATFAVNVEAGAATPGGDEPVGVGGDDLGLYS